MRRPIVRITFKENICEPTEFSGRYDPRAIRAALRNKIVSAERGNIFANLNNFSFGRVNKIGSVPENGKL